MKPRSSSAVFKQIFLPVLLLLNIIPGIAYEDPLLECNICLPDVARQAPGVGFELTTSYASSGAKNNTVFPRSQGQLSCPLVSFLHLQRFTNPPEKTASVRYYNGSTIDLAFVPAPPAYAELLTRLSQFTAPPKPSKLQQYLHRLNKLLGRPATLAVGTISALISYLRGEVEAQLNHALDRVVVTTPQFPGLTREDLEDAIQHAGLKSWLGYPLPYPTMLYAPNAAFAANGQGLCKELENIYACLEEAEDGDIPLEQVFAVTFTNATLHTAVSHISYAFVRNLDTHIAAPHLGLSMLPAYHSPSAYRADVCRHFQTLPSEVAGRGRPTSTVLLLGENAAMPEFLTVLRDALSAVSVAAKTVTWDEDRDNETQVSADLEGGRMVRARLEPLVDPLWAAARGAALYARLRQEVPWNCAEPRECKNFVEAGATEGVKEVILESDELR